jgi:hypothetical protein
MVNKSRQSKIGLFTYLQEKKLITIPDVNIAAVAMEGCNQNVIMTWLQSEKKWKLTDAAYPLAVLNLQMLGIHFDGEEVLFMIKRFLESADERFDTFRVNFTTIEGKKLFLSCQQ